MLVVQNKFVNSWGGNSLGSFPGLKTCQGSFLSFPGPFPGPGKNPGSFQFSRALKLVSPNTQRQRKTLRECVGRVVTLRDVNPKHTTLTSSKPTAI